MSSIFPHLFCSKLHVEGASNRWKSWKDSLSFQRTLKILKKLKYQLQFLDEYVLDHPEVLLSPLRQKHDRFSPCSFEKAYGWKVETLQQQWNSIPSQEYRLDIIASLPEASLWGYSFFVATQEGTLLRDSSWDLRVFRKAGDRPSVTRRLSGKAVILPLHRCRNYFHWLLEVLPRVQLLEEEGLWNRIPVVIPRWEGFYKESLRLLGLDPKFYVEFDPDKDHFQFEEAIYPSRLGSIRKVAPTSVHYLREKLVPRDPKRSRKIYYSRRSASTRRVLNEEEFLPDLVSRGFEIFTGEGVSMENQIQIFSEATCVIGAHGAGLANLVFCAPMTPVLELMGSTYINPVMGELCDSGGLRYSVYVGQTEHEQGHYRVDRLSILDWLENIS